MARCPTLAQGPVRGFPEPAPPTASPAALSDNAHVQTCARPITHASAQPPCPYRPPSPAALSDAAYVQPRRHGGNPLHRAEQNENRAHLPRQPLPTHHWRGELRLWTTATKGQVEPVPVVSTAPCRCNCVLCADGHARASSSSLYVGCCIISRRHRRSSTTATTNDISTRSTVSA